MSKVKPKVFYSRFGLRWEEIKLTIYIFLQPWQQLQSIGGTWVNLKKCIVFTLANYQDRTVMQTKE